VILGSFCGTLIPLLERFWNLLPVKLLRITDQTVYYSSAVERQFEIIGEALNQLCKIEPAWAERIPDLPQIVAFRNLLIHGYASVNDLTVWNTIESSLPALHETLANLLND